MEQRVVFGRAAQSKSKILYAAAVGYMFLLSGPLSLLSLLSSFTLTLPFISLIKGQFVSLLALQQ